MQYIIFLLTAVLPAIKCITGDTLVFQRDSAPAHWLAKRSNCWSAKPQTSSFRICVPQRPWRQSGRLEALGGGSCNSRSIRRHSKMWMNSRSNQLKSGLVWSRTYAINIWRKRLRACVHAKGRHFEHLL